LSGENKKAMFDLPAEKKWQLYQSKKKVLSTDIASHLQS
jgi:hypothetical protein